MFFFFSSRRRHTRCSRDWSSDVCSSDLKIKVLHAIGPNVGLGTRIGAVAEVGALSEYRSVKPLSQPLIERTRGQMRQRGSDRSGAARVRSEEHTSELQSRLHLVCRLLLEKKKQETACSQ